MKSKLFLLVVAIIFCNAALAQTLSPAVIASSGGFYANGTAMLSSTIGEMAMVETFSNTNAILTQGFQQSEDFNVSVKNIDPVTFGITLGPNPTQGAVHLFFSAMDAVKVNITIFDISGKIIYRNETEKLANNNYVSLNLSALSCGDYIFDCKISSHASDLPQSFSKKITVIQ